ncbi:MAG: acetolactate synthase large subunit [Actinomycetota bacterium]|jgi:acetolactate synthase-1/2/3 large subunit
MNGAPAGHVAILSGAEAIARTAADEGFQLAFVYPGTSELALCSALAQALLVSNSRGDAEAVFFAGGANLVPPARAIAVVHGARGLTNAAGAIADLRRNEIPAVVVVGLPSTQSRRFQPPHGEDDLVAGVGAFAKAAFEILDEPGDLTDVAVSEAMRAACRGAASLPTGPVILGLPQDVLEFRGHRVANKVPQTEEKPASGELAAAALDIANALRPVILVDDLYIRGGAYALRTLDTFADAIAAPVFQVAYRRGPMLFAQLNEDDVVNFRGHIEPDNPAAVAISSADMIITVEDRNMYPRVVGPLPACRKVALSSNPAMTAKNEYLGSGDRLIVGYPPLLLEELTERLHPLKPRSPLPVQSEPSEDDASTLAERFVEAIGASLSRLDDPYIVDDSQMLGGLIARHFRKLPRETTIFGDHGGFVGAGSSFAVGLSIANPTRPVLCLLGDQGFTNGVKALVAAGEQATRLVFVVANNGESVSLRKQARSLERVGDEAPNWLRNVSSLNYTAVARAAGLSATQVDLYADGPYAVERAITDGFATGMPSFVEILLPPLGDFWDGVWTVQGRDHER